MIKLRFVPWALMWSVLSFGLIQGANAADLRISIQDADAGVPLADAVIEVLLPPDMQASHTQVGDFSVDQQQREFVSNVTVISRGSRVNFPNSDDILHHVYSFSTANVFELPLYGNGQNVDYFEPFEQAGVVELGCNIHDWMLGYIYVAETSLAVRTDAHLGFPPVNSRCASGTREQSAAVKDSPMPCCRP